MGLMLVVRNDESLSRICWTIWITILLHSLTVTNPHKGANGLKRELFFLNLEDGFFGCQVNESVDVLKVFELSKLCDGSPQCFLGSDELHEDLKCSDDCTEKTGRKCDNGVCLSSQCYCNDGFGGKGCEMPDENECKFRPCDIFAHCTNTLGSFGCACFNGYEGDGFRCKDIDECKIPSFRSTCVANAECWNLPGHYACRCLPGFEGDGKVECRDIKECLRNPCGEFSVCEEKVGGGYTCQCQPGYTGQAMKPEGCHDINECSQLDSPPCSGKAECHNLQGTFECTCPRGYVQVNTTTTGPDVSCKQASVATKCDSNFDCVNNAECLAGTCACRPGFEAVGPICQDVDECQNKPCGVEATCGNLPGGFRCECGGKYPVGDPFVQCKASCEDVNCGSHAHCSTNEVHFESGEAYCICEEGWSYDPKNISAGCTDINECDLGTFGPCGNHSNCHNVDGSYTCTCQKGFRAESKTKEGCSDINECDENSHNCGVNSLCVNLVGGYDCTCPSNMIGDPRVKCTLVTKCHHHGQCPGNGVCDSSKGYCVCTEPNVGEDCRHPCEKVTCGPRAECVLVNDLATCVCPTGFHGSPSTSEGCLDIDECLFQPCGEGICRNEPGQYRCECPLGFEPLRVQNSSGYPESCRSVSPRSCRRATDCPIGEECVDHSVNHKVCVCPRGFTRDFKLGECRDVNECLELEVAPCGINAECRNVPGSYECTCPSKYPVGNPYQKCEECNAQRCPCPSPYRLVNTSCVTDNCSPHSPCANGGQCVSVAGGLNYCACPKGYTNGPDGSCQDVNECLKVGVCGPGAECFNKPGSFKCVCPMNFQGDAYKEGCSHPLLKCHSSSDCSTDEQCVDPGVCVCAPPYEKDDRGGCQLRCNASGEGSGKVCSAAQKRTCTAGDCGTNADCVEGSCICKLGFDGDPYSKCEDLNECEDELCGRHAHCINLPGTYDCRCELSHPLGNPFVECIELPQNLIDCLRSRCSCSDKKACPVGFTCKAGLCVDECHGVKCGANSVCSAGKCVCVSGFTGENPTVGCEYRTCENDQSCSAQEICYGSATGRICVDGCSRMECEPNSVCFTESHRSSCICKEFFEPDGKNCSPIKITERVDECGSSVECFDGFVCSFAQNGVRKCIDPCASATCGGSNQICVREKGRAVCKCKPGFTMSHGTCQLPPLSKCLIDDDCPKNNECVQDSSGIGHCTAVRLCDSVTCAPNALCISEVTTSGASRRVACHCKQGFTGNADDRVGCVPMAQNECVEDIDCSENHICVGGNSGTKCQLACDGIKCGPNSLCVSNNHIAQCQCLPGKFKPDSNDPSKGCSPVPCIYNSDCQPHQTCNRLESQCHDVCVTGSCGKNALCIPERHSYRCACAPGFSGHDPDSGCHPLNDCANHNPCHASAQCVLRGQEITCTCPEATQGDPYGPNGCDAVSQVKSSKCTSHDECPPGEICRDRKCVDPCTGGCAGKHSICRVVDRMAICTCQEGFEASTRNNQTTCAPISTKCSVDLDCLDGICVDKQCKVICSTKSDCSSDEVCLFGMCMLPCIGHAQCARGQTCAGGYCIRGCRTNKECTKEEACLNHQCSNPCDLEGTCGPNSLCRPVSHSPHCFCPDGFIPSNSNGCYRNNTQCVTTQDCLAGHLCIGGSCFFSCDSTVTCARGEQCQTNVCVKVCYSNANCHLGEICVEGVCAPGCRSDVDCGLSETCISSKCRCGPGFTSGPTGCRDINECDLEDSCHDSANCLNSPGSFRCVCPEGLVSDNPQRSPCQTPPECITDRNCLDGFSCSDVNGLKKCINPCTFTKCGPRAECRAGTHKGACFCPANHLGDPYSLEKGCQLTECEEDIDCPNDRYCDAISGRCLNPCDVSSCGSHALCEVDGHQGTCSCLQGFALTNGSCQDINECEAELGPCQLTAKCSNFIGGYMCDCPEGTVDDPLRVGGCKVISECSIPSDCPDTANCVEGKCVAVCEAGTCGAGTKCEAKVHLPICSCLPNYFGDPSTACKEVKCQEESDCNPRETCYKNDCISPCDIPHICGQHSNCTVINHKALCLCSPGHTGDPVLGCIPILTCDPQAPCPSGSVCLNKNCRQLCTAHRDCASIQSCIQGICQSPCTFDSDCTTGQICSIGFCKEHGICQENSNCESHQICNANSQGISICEPICGIETICPRNSHCSAKDHVRTCLCDNGFRLDPTGNCVQEECSNDSMCPEDRTCVNFQCQVTCKVPKACPPHSICTAVKHLPACSCLPGFVPASSAENGSALSCVEFDFCASGPCGPGQLCQSTGQAFRCVCTGANCDTEAKHAVSCNAVTCAPNSKCREPNGPCDCLPGFKNFRPGDPSGGCVPLADCPKGEDCIKKISYCNGTECFGPCASNAECESTEVCIGSQCVNPCDKPSPCGLNAICSTVDHVKLCGCKEDFTGIPEVECVRVATPCRSSEHCAGNQTCSNGICFPKCQSDLGCASNERCVEDHCMLTCRLDNDCFLNHVCLRGMCVSGCRSNGDCPSGETCQQQKCTDLCKMDACGPNALCRTVDHQPKCSCQPGMLPNPTALVGCIREPTTCTDNRDCATALLCVTGRCRQSCSSTSNCFSNEICHAGFCSASCRSDDDCPQSDICQHAVCTQGCRSNDACRSDESCIGNKCSNPCKICNTPGNCSLALQGQKGSCGSNSVCNVEEHKVVCQCEAPYVGDPYKFCAIPEIKCGSGGHCPEEMSCVETQCRISCSNDDKCQSDERCVQGICHPVCSQDGQCTSSQICQGRICVTGCRSDLNCPSNLSCVNRRCSDPCQVSPCGACATCETVGHRPLCTCPLDWAGDPERGCQKPYVPCNAGSCPGGRTCLFGSCVNKCQRDSECQCRQSCHRGLCLNLCSEDHDCASGESCENSHCQPKCRQNSDCAQTQSCDEGQCIDPCLSKACSLGSAHCKVTQHRPICLCANASPEVNGECGESFCSKDVDCKNVNFACMNEQCKNPCLETDICGEGASCRVVNRKPFCICPIGWTGSPTIKCVQVGKDDCRENGCGLNSTCVYTENGYRCTCLPSCVPRTPGSLEEGCKCSAEKQVSNPGGSCNLKCGTLALCKIEDNNQKRCVCPLEYPEGDPMIGCSAPLERIDDCRIKPCGVNALCLKVNGLFTCRCPAGSLGNPDVECLRVKTQCREDSDCSLQEGCIKGHCQNLCDEHICPDGAKLCQVTNHRVACIVNEVELTLSADESSKPAIFKSIACNSSDDCANDLACDLTSDTCQDPCTWTTCRPNQQCRVQDHVPLCLCKGFVITQRMELTCPEVQPVKCSVNDDCAEADTCIFGTCQDPCLGRNCSEGKKCQVHRHIPYCMCAEAECSPMVEICFKNSGCPRNLSCIKYQCQNPCDTNVCPSGQRCIVQEHKAICQVCTDDALDLCQVSSDVVECSVSADCASNLLCVNDLCRDPCLTENPCSVDEACRVVNQTISCQISPPPILISCSKDSQCPNTTHCSPVTSTCENPCTLKKCGSTSYCVVENQVAKCYCLEGGLEHEGNCIRRFRTDFPRPEMTVNCLADGIQVDILTGPFGPDFRTNGSEFNGLLYVKGHSKDPQCRKIVQPYLETVDFEVKFGSCGLIHNDGGASFVMVIQKHPRLVTYNAQAYDIKCVYMTGEKTITLGFNVSMLTTSGTIANTGPPPTCSMRIATATGGEITSAEIGESLVLRIDVQPSSIYGGFARRCVAKTMEGDGENEYPVTDEDGCASDPSVFGDWEFESETQILMAHFNAFKFPSSSSIKFQCNVRVCFGTCPPVNCRGQEAFGRRRRSTDQNLLSQVGFEGQLREEVQIESNPILAIERREDRYQNPTESPQTLKEEVCISTTGFILSLIVTSILSLVAVAVAVSCWILAYKRRKRNVGPLPHPPEFPNPLFTSTELITEPLPDYVS